MRLFFLTHRIPFPPNKGDKIRSYNILNYLVKHHDVNLACLVDDESDLGLVPEIKSRVNQFVFDRIRPLKKKLFALRSLVYSTSLTVSYFYSPGLQMQIDKIIDAEDIDAFICFSSPMAEYLFRSRHANGKIYRAIRIMDLIDIDSYKWRQYAEERSMWISWIYRHEAKHLAEYEKRIVKEFDHVLVVTEQEKKLFPESGEMSNLDVMSNGVDLEFFVPVPAQRLVAIQPTLVFTGVMDYQPNVDGMKWFVESVFPRIQVAIPDIELLIVGNKPTREVERLGQIQGVVVTGFVEDIREYLAKANVCIVPLKTARGIQNKVLEAMAMGKAVVCTPQAHEGIHAIPDEEIIVAGDAEAFVVNIISLLENKSKAEQLGIKARLRVEQEYSWEKNLSLLDQILPADSPIRSLLEIGDHISAT